MNTTIKLVSNLYLCLLVGCLMLFSACEEESDGIKPEISNFAFHSYDSKLNQCSYSFNSYDNLAVKSIRVFKNNVQIFSNEHSTREELARFKNNSRITFPVEFSNDGYVLNVEVEDFGNNVQTSTLTAPYYENVYSPKAGENFLPGTSTTIGWKSNSVDKNAYIQLFKGESLIRSIATAVNNGKYTWTVPSNLTAADNYTIRVRSIEIEPVYASSEPFSISPVLSVAYPHAGAVCLTGSTISLSWSDNIDEYLNIDLYQGNTFMQNIVSNTNYNYYNWLIPGNLKEGSDYNLRFTRITNKGNQVFSSGNFTIQTMKITLTSPTGASINSGSTQTIIWTDNLKENVKVELYWMGKLHTTLSTGVAGNSIAWQVPVGLKGTGFALKLSSVSNSAVYTMSSEFEIVSTFSYGTVTDIEGNVYKTVKIGNQTWMVENLRTTKYNDGTAIPEVAINASWIGLSTPGYCWYNNDPANHKSTYGALYNWHTVNTGKLAPAGWHVPTQAEWNSLLNAVGGSNVAGGNLKGLTLWDSPNIGASNAYGFNAVPGGTRSTSGSFMLLGYSGQWWSATQYNATNSYIYIIYCNNAAVTSGYSTKINAASILCVKD